MGFLNRTVCLTVLLAAMASPVRAQSANQTWDDGYRRFQDVSPEYLEIRVTKVATKEDHGFFGGVSTQITLQASVDRVFRSQSGIQPGQNIIIQFTRQANAGTGDLIPPIPPENQIIPAFLRKKGAFFEPAAKHHSFEPLAAQQVLALEQAMMTDRARRIAEEKKAEEERVQNMARVLEAQKQAEAEAVARTEAAKRSSQEPPASAQPQIETTPPAPAPEKMAASGPTPGNATTETLPVETVTTDTKKLSSKVASIPTTASNESIESEKLPERPAGTVPTAEPAPVPAPEVPPATVAVETPPPAAEPPPPPVEVIVAPAPARPQINLPESTSSKRGNALPELPAVAVETPKPVEAVSPAADTPPPPPPATLPEAPQVSQPTPVPVQEPIAIAEVKPSAPVPEATPAAPDPAQPEAKVDDGLESYVVIYAMMKEGDDAENHGELKTARDAYEKANTQLQKLHQEKPDFQPFIVEFRLKDLRRKIDALNLKLSPPKP